MINALIMITGAHYIADYPLQGTFLATTKGQFGYSLLAHSIIYAFVIALCLQFMGVYAFWKICVVFLSHMIIDHKKATAKNKDKALKSYLYIDQGLHMGINILLLFM